MVRSFERFERVVLLCSVCIEWMCQSVSAVGSLPKDDRERVDPTGYRKNRNTNVPVVAVDQIRFDYGYDKTSNVTEVAKAVDSDGVVDTYGYDGNGNRTCSTVIPAKSQTPQPESTCSTGEPTTQPPATELEPTPTAASSVNHKHSTATPTSKTVRRRSPITGVLVGGPTGMVVGGKPSAL